MTKAHESTVRNVSDTARWVAAYRAEETAHRHPLFHDPLAERLAGARGHAIAAQASIHSRWVLVTRTKLIDDLVLTSVAEGVDCVVNLAAGFDARPYRLPVPPSLRWVEVDLPALVEEKNRLLDGEEPRCALRRVGADLADPQARKHALKSATDGASKVLVITEGLVVYLEREVVSSLAEDLAEPPIAFWILDFSSPEIIQMMKKSMASTFAQAPLKFAPEEGMQFFAQRGWQHKEVYSLFREAARLRRLPWILRPFAWLPQPDVIRPKGGRWSALVRLERQAP